MIDLELKNSIQALLFAWAEPISMEDLAKYFEITMLETVALLNEIKSDFAASGIRLTINGNLVSLSTNPKYGEVIKGFGKTVIKKRISDANMETLSIIAYMQPTTKSVVDNIRGVKSDVAIQNLINRGLIKEVGRLKAPGKPFVYKTTDMFLKTFDVESLSDLPPLMDREEIKEKLQFTEVSPEDIELIEKESNKQQEEV